MKQLVFALIGVGSMFGLASVAGCTRSHDVGSGAEASGQILPIELDESCLEEIADSVNSLPRRLSCTGLYSDVSKREVARGIEPYVPGARLWSDGLNKSRYIYLPPGTTIDASQPNAWSFPAGTRFWKEFLAPDSETPVETRLYLKKEEGDWRQSTYQWNPQLTEALRVDQAKTIMVGDQMHYLPSPSDCEECHKGRRDRVLGFEQIALGLPEASGETLEKLVAANRLKNFDGATENHIGEDDESVEAHALGWMHMNCGVTCHNDVQSSKGYSTGLRMRLDPAQLDGGPLGDLAVLKTGVGVEAKTMRWLGRTRIVPGSSQDSLLYALITQRGDKAQQMPPIATFLVDTENTDWVKAWIDGLPAQ
jgi:hypothetical protein